MALYVPAARRRRRLLVFTGAALLVGLLLGAFIGRGTAPTVDDRIEAVRNDARQTAAGLRVIALHDESNAVSNAGEGDGGTQLVLDRTRAELREEFDDAPWITTEQRDELINALDGLDEQSDRTSETFGRDAEALADKIDAAFGTAT